MGLTNDIKGIERQAVIALDRHHVALYLVLAATLFGASYLWSAWRASTADARAAVSEARYAEAQKQNAAFQRQVAAQLDALKQQNDALAAQNQALAAAVVARERQLTDRQRQDQQLSPVALAERWGALLAQPGAVASTPTGYAVTPPAAQATVLALEELPVRRLDVRDLTTQVANLETVAANDATALDLEKRARAGDQATCAAGLRAKDDEIKKVRADAARAKRRWGAVGFILGTIARGFIRH